MRRTAPPNPLPPIGEVRLLICSLLLRARGNPARAARLARVDAAAERILALRRRSMRWARRALRSEMAALLLEQHAASQQTPSAQVPS